MDISHQKPGCRVRVPIRATSESNETHGLCAPSGSTFDHCGSPTAPGPGPRPVPLRDTVLPACRALRVHWQRRRAGGGTVPPQALSASDFATPATRRRPGLGPPQWRPACARSLRRRLSPTQSLIITAFRGPRAGDAPCHGVLATRNPGSHRDRLGRSATRFQS